MFQIDITYLVLAEMHSRNVVSVLCISGPAFPSKISNDDGLILVKFLNPEGSSNFNSLKKNAMRLGFHFCAVAIVLTTLSYS